MVTAVLCPSCGAPIAFGLASCPYCRVALSWPGEAPPTSVDAPEAPAGVVEQLRAGNKIGAIKAYHQARKSSLLEARRFVDDLEQRLGLRAR